jgi:general secretion pathway protein D
MRKFRALAAGLALVLLAACGAGSGAFKDGRKAAQRKDWDTALVAFERAREANPGNARYILWEQQARTQAAIAHVERGRKLLPQGRLDEAAGAFQRAVSIDPSNQAAAQELSRVLAQQTELKRTREETIQETLRGREDTEPPGGAQLQPFPTEPLSQFRVSADSRRVYETLAKLANLNVAFSPDFQPRPISVDLKNVLIEDALSIVGFQTKSFWRAITPNTILVVTDNPANRRDFEEQVLKTIYLSNPLAPADRTAITTALKQVLGLQRIIDNPDSNAIIVRDTPAKVAAAERLIRGLDQGKAEILIDVSIVEADRNRLRDLGLTQVATSPLPSTAIGGIGFTGRQTVGDVPTIPLNEITRISTRDFSIVLPGAVANALLSDAQTRIIQNPQVRVTDGMTAKLRIGSRVPFATGSFLPSLGGVQTGTGFGLLASTQFQYQDVGVNVDITPRLLPNGEVALRAQIEISSLQAPIQIGGFSQPTFGQRRIEHDIRLKEGEVNLLGGLIERKEVESWSGLPGLGEIPLLRYLFSSEHRERVETEILVMLTPRVIRLPEFGRERVTSPETQLRVSPGEAPPQPEPPPPQEAPTPPPQE